MNHRFDPDTAAQSVLFGGGQMGEAMRALDWSATALGPVEGWPQSLRTVVRVLLDSRYAMWLAWGPELVFFCNDAYRPTLGIKRDFLGASARQVWAEIWPDIGPRIEKVLTTGTATWDEGLLLFLERRGFPEETYHSFSYSPVYDDAGRVAGMLCVVSEDTERTVGERRLATLAALSGGALSARSTEEACTRAAQAMAANVQDLPFSLIYLLGEDGRPLLAARTGLADAAAGAAALDPACWPLEDAAAAGALQTVEDVVARCGAVRAGPYPEPVARALVLPLPRPGPLERPAGFLVAGLSPRLPLDAGYHRFLDLVAAQTATAISDARAFAEEKRRAAALAELDRAKTVFFSNVSHELRTPLTLMLGPIGDLLAAPAEAPPRRELLGLAQRNGERLLRLVNTLLDFSRIEAGRLQARYEPIDLARYTAELASVFRAALERAGVALVIDCTPLDEPVHVDREMWEKIVLNLLSNAFKFTFEGEVRVSLARHGGEALLTVADTGTGIAAEALPRLFERFYRVPGARGRSIEGSGIGLALVQELARLHGGSVTVASREGEGSRFEVRVKLGSAHLPAEQLGACAGPLARAPDAESWLGAEQADDVRDTALLPLHPGEGWGEGDAAQEQEQDNRPLILLADDNADMRGYIRRLLAAEHRVVAVGDGASALRVARERRPALLVSDVMMPGLDGFALLRAVRADPDLAPMAVILLSARAGSEARIEGLAAGADDYLIKPFNARELLARVSGTLALACLRRERAEREAALRAETENVLASIAEGFMAVDADWRITYANSAAERMVFKPREAMLGRPLWQLFPEVAGSPFEEPYRRAMRERVTVRVDARYEPLDAWLEVNVYPVAGGGLAFYFRDVLESRLMQEALRASDESHRFQVALDEALRVLSEPAEIMAATTRMLAAQFGADRCAYGEVEDDGAHIAVLAEHLREPLPGMLGRRALDDFGAAPLALLRAGRPQLIEDAEADESIGSHARAAYRAVGSRAHLRVPLLKDGRLVAALGLHQSRARRWTPAELALARIVIERCWQAVLRARAEAALAEREREFRVLADAMPQIVYVCNADGSSRFINSQWEAYTGRAGVTPEDTGAAIHPDDAEPLQRRWAEALAAGQPLTAELRLRGRDGGYRWFLTRALPSRDASGCVVHWYGTSTDIDAHKRGEEALRASEQRFRGLADALPNIVFACGPEGDVRWVNQFALDWLGVTPDAVLGQARYALLHPDDREGVRQCWRAALERGDAYESQSRLRRADGSFRWVLSRALPMRGDDGLVKEWVGGSVDIDELRSVQQELQQADRRKDEFLATLAHELRNPLAPLRNSVHLLRLSPNAETARRLEPMMRRQIDHLVRLVDDLLEVSRIGGGKIELKRAPVLLATVLASAVETSRPLIEAGGHTLVQEHGDEPLLLDADAVRLAQVFANLLNNAAKYTDAGGRIELKAARGGAQAVVTVADSGTGIAPEMLPQLFALFMQIDRSAARAQGGLGIGLSLVKSLVGLHGGSVEAASAGLGHGSVFTVRLPLAGGDATAVAARGPAEGVPLPVQQRVLVVDDNRDAADSLGVLLEYLGASVQIVHDGPAALAALAGHRPHVVLLDIGMPGMDGHEVARRMRALPQGGALTLIALTGWGQAQDRERSRESGFDHHLVKPADIEQLRGLLERAQ